MEKNERKNHWNHIYETKELKDVSWFQPKPETSLYFIHEFHIPKSAKIIDVGGGDSLLVDHLLDLGYEDLTVLDISEKAIEKAKQRLGNRAEKVKWIVSDIVEFNPTEKYDFWHDRAAFHFLTTEADVTKYLEIAKNAIQPNAIIVVGTFSESGPKKCSGLEIKQYSEKSLSDKLASLFKKIKCITVNHVTPFQTIQNFVFCSFLNSGASF
ncbi:MAG: class I SAM-dependent methyltransferase [Bacteroidota bacterium]|jgi:2-polyprenyl-3-methyl-5-hydroxy-6-metoxy-1,4-benzoquinol methylase